MFKCSNTVSVIVVLLVVFISGCASTSKNFSFDPVDGEALIVLGIPGTSVEATYVFSKIDEQTNLFDKERKVITFGSLIDDTLGKNGNIQFAKGTVPEGLYALTFYQSLAVDPKSKVYRGYQCFSEGAPVYKIEKGKINLISVPKFSSVLNGFQIVSGDAYIRLRESFNVVRESYAELKGETRQAEVDYLILFSEKNGLTGLKCGLPKSPYTKKVSSKS